MRLAVVKLLGIVLVGLPPCWTALSGSPSLCPVRLIEPGAAIDLRSIDALRDPAAQEKLGLSDDQRVEIGRRLALTLDPDQRDLLQMILGQYHADRNRLCELEDPTFEDDEEGASYELPRLRAMAGEFSDRAAAMVDRILTPGQRAAISTRPRPIDPGALSRELAVLQQDSSTAIAAILVPHQHEQLRQIAIDAEGPLAVVRPEVAARLNISLDQQTRVRTIWAKAQADLDRLRGPSPISPAYRKGDDLEVWMKPRLATIQIESARILADAKNRICDVLQK
jgi:hypothetical protein